MSIPYTRKIAETDVRVGNIILYKSVPTRVEIFHIQQMQAFSPDCEPVGLTVEWLEKAGFNWNKLIHRWVHSSGFKLVQDDLGIHNGIGDGSFKQPYLKFLHQLQNLYYSLTGEELEITPF